MAWSPWRLLERLIVWLVALVVVAVAVVAVYDGVPPWVDLPTFGV